MRFARAEEREIGKREIERKRDIVLVRDHLPSHFSPPGFATARRRRYFNPAQRRRNGTLIRVHFVSWKLAAEKWQFIIFISLSLSTVP